MANLMPCNKDHEVERHLYILTSCKQVKYVFSFGWLVGGFFLHFTWLDLSSLSFNVAGKRRYSKCGDYETYRSALPSRWLKIYSINNISWQTDKYQHGWTSLFFDHEGQQQITLPPDHHEDTRGSKWSTACPVEAVWGVFNT